jgi:hypothetical protein
MPTVTYNYVAFSAGSHTRQPTRTGTGGFELLQSNPGGDPGSGTFAAPSPPPTIVLGAPPNQQTFDFSFMTVSGGSETQGGPPVGKISFDPLNPPPPVFLGEIPINVLVVYVQIGGSGSGATIDEFDETTGQLLNDTFVGVAPDPTETLTTSANVEGFVDTTSADEVITALPTATPSGVDFVGWVNLGPPGQTISSPNLRVGKDQSVRALAFYQTPPSNLGFGTIAGTVMLDSEGSLSPGAAALVSASPGGTAKPGPDDGSYILTNLRPGLVQLTVGRLPLTTIDHATVTVVAGQTITQNFVVSTHSRI